MCIHERDDELAWLKNRINSTQKRQLQHAVLTWMHRNSSAGNTAFKAARSAAGTRVRGPIKRNGEQSNALQSCLRRDGPEK